MNLRSYIIVISQLVVIQPRLCTRISSGAFLPPQPPVQTAERTRRDFDAADPGRSPGLAVGRCLPGDGGVQLVPRAAALNYAILLQLCKVFPLVTHFAQ